MFAICLTYGLHRLQPRTYWKVGRGPARRKEKFFMLKIVQRVIQWHYRPVVQEIGPTWKDTVDFLLCAFQQRRAAKFYSEVETRE